ncbi:MAG: AmmeMemoRadiSam system protein B [Thermoprotei archaeon]|nr:MAG: AmmeMemoRadiSam system protein B [Thermoprotei archaeon]
MFKKIRKPAVSGQFYPSDPKVLRDEIEKLFLSKIGPGRLPSVASTFSGDLVGVVSPHAGYMYSGSVAAHGIFALSASGKPEVIFILGPNHHGLGDPLALSGCEAWETPLGLVPVDLEVSKKLVEKTGILSFNDTAHMYEHSIEVQLPLLQYVFSSEFKIVPISMMLQNPEASRIIGESIASLILDKGLKAYIIASSDFSHYVEANIAKEKDDIAISRIMNLDYKGLYDVVIEYDISMCGPGPVMALIVAAKRLGVTKGTLLRYASSGDITGDYSSVVAYASIAFYKET